MIMSMTGYGNATGNYEGMELTVELKSVNNRFLDTNIRLPRGFLFAEDTLKKAIAEKVNRGKVDVFVTIDSAGAEDFQINVNEPLLEGYLQALHGISEKYGLHFDLTASGASRLPDVLTVEKKEADQQAIADALVKLTQEAVDNFNEMRAREGKKLEEDILSKLCGIESMISAVEEASPKTVADYRARLEAKMQEVLGQTGVDETRILTEAAIFADKVAVDEETVRLRSHIEQMRGMFAEGSPIGRKMDFLVQEFNREANTIGSKCNDKDVTKIVVDLKSEIEKIREQIQNIE